MEEENLITFISNTKFEKKIIYISFENIFLKDSNIKINKIFIETGTAWRRYNLTLNNINYVLHIKFKSITSGGWEKKPQVRRIQITRNHLDNIVDTKVNELTLLSGFVVFKKTPLFCFWNPKRYMTHKTTCSCYVNVSSINKAYNDGYYFGHDSGKEVYICNSLNFQRVIKEFISNNYISDFKW